jgi:acylphosphatase
MGDPAKPAGGPIDDAAGGGPMDDAVAGGPTEDAVTGAPANDPAAGAGSGLRRVRVLVEGRVQGVWFRDSTREEALRLGVAGWVCNLPDGRVEVVFEGPPKAVATLLVWTRHGPEHAVVTHIEMREEPPVGDRGFRIRA